ncbi:M48 family metalloprotease [Streptomyces sp. HNM0645]|uniref:M48 family metalloprotease n=1 Tax=Streptomyces sp. HNM0645 TaxID=2782343 RepID=UPI0024B7D82C|nr:M48 family metallopeptidase [Streptomyces sp. HNM0645]MDI9889265.1 M48 family metalloprotease [Streptomyces sp. HNM0645]
MSRLRRVLRSAGALALVIGFYALAVVLIGGYAVFGVVMSHVVFDPEGELGLSLLPAQISFAVAALVMVAQLVMGIGGGAAPRRGTLAVGTDDALGLWETVWDLAERTGAPAPTEIRLTMEANAAVSEQAGAPGRARERRLYVGLPLLAGLRADELRAVLAHELGHYAQRHTRFAATVYRGATGLDAAREGYAKTELGNPIVTVYTGFQHLTLGLYAWVYNALSFAVRRRQELEADEAAAAVVGRDAAVRALTSTVRVAAAWEDFRSQVLTPMAELGRLPDDPLRAFAAALSGPECARTGARRVAEGTRHPVSARHPFDSHPPLEQRLDALRALPAGRAEPDQRPAHFLINEDGVLPDGVLAALVPSPRPPGRERLTRPWSDWLTEAAEARAVRAVEELDAAVGLIALARPTTGGVLDLLTGARGGELVDALRDTGWGERWQAAPLRVDQGTGADGGRRAGESWWVRHMADRWEERGETPSRSHGRQDRHSVGEQRAADDRRAVLALELLIGQALVAAGRARWTFCMHGPGRVVPEGPSAAEALELATAALTDPDSAARLRARLLLCRVPLETQLNAAGPDSALRVPAESAGVRSEGRPARPAFPVAVFLMALVALLLFALRWDLVNQQRSRPSLPDRYPPAAPPFQSTCPPGHLAYGDLCVRMPTATPTEGV